MGNLELHWQPDGPRYFLDGEPVHAGNILEARKGDSMWAAVRFEYHWDRKNNTVEPFLIRSKNEGDTELIDAHSECRWPA